jgi:hypothetical protein
MWLHQLIYLLVEKAFSLEDKGLSHFIERGVVEVLGGKGSGINHGKTGISAINDVLFCQFHNAAPFSLFSTALF